MWILKACAVCLSTDIKLYPMDECNGLRQDFNSVACLNSRKGDGLPRHLCVECAAYVRRYKAFQNKCQRANFTLQEILNKKKEIKKSDITAIDRQTLNIMPTLAYWTLGRCYYEETKFQWVKYSRNTTTELTNAPILTTSTIDNTEPPNKKFKWTDTTDKEIKIEQLDKPKLVNVEYEQFELETKDEIVLLEVDNVEIHNNDYGDDNFQCDNDFITVDQQELPTVDVETKPVEADGSKLNEEYANVFLLNNAEQQAAAEVYKLFSHGKFRCEICNKGYYSERRLKVHLRMHEKHVSGTFFCELCSYYYKTEYLLNSHITEKHLYKYVCTKCPEVNFDRTSAKQHYIWVHMQKKKSKGTNWYDSRPSWISKKGGKRIRKTEDTADGMVKVVTIKPVKKTTKIPKDFPIYTPVGHLEQYELVKERQNSRNYKESNYKCNLCYRGFIEVRTFNNHLKKHDPVQSGPLQCDICKIHLNNTRKMYKHMVTLHIHKFSCRQCDFVCHNMGQARAHYRWHNNVKFTCPHCDKEFRKSSTRLTHIRIKHPSTNLCNICGHSFVSRAGLYFHQKRSHTKEEVGLSEKLTLDPSTEGTLCCTECNMQFMTQQAYIVHLGSSNKHVAVNLSVCQPLRERPSRRVTPTASKKRRPRRPGPSEIHNNGVATATNCEECGLLLLNDVQTRRHYKAEHPGSEYLKRYMCDVCGHVTQQYNNLLVHMRTHTNEKPYACPYCDRRFSMTSNRDRHLVVHTGEKRYECEHCHRRFSQSSAVKLHIQTVHMKIPYAPWDKKNRKRRKQNQTNQTPTQPEHKFYVESQGEYLNAFISYHE